MLFGLALSPEAAFLYQPVGAQPIPTIITPTPGEVVPPGSDFTAETDTFTFPTGAPVTNTSWRIRKVSDNSIVWSDLHDAVNKFSVTVPANTLAPNTAYRLLVQFFGSHLTTRKATVDFVTGA